MDINDIQELALAIHLRRYSRLYSVADGLIRNHGWKQVAVNLRDIPLWGGYRHQGYIYPQDEDIQPVREGVLRDGILQILGLGDMPGIDVDLLDTFGEIEARNLQELHDKVTRKAMNILKDQIADHNTYFMNTKELAETKFASLVPLIKEARAEEILELGTNPHIGRVVETYYGFSEIVGGLASHDKEALKEVRELPIKPHGTPSYQQTMFPNCSEELRGILINSLRVVFTRNVVTHKKGILYLWSTGDSRGLPAIYVRLKMDSAPHIISRAFRALGAIGHPDSFSYLKALLMNPDGCDEHLPAFRRYHATRSSQFFPEAFDALLSNNHPDITKTVLSILKSDYCPSRETYYEQLWRLYDPRVIPYLVEIADNHTEVVFQTLLKIKGGREAALDNLDKLIELLREKPGLFDSHGLPPMFERLPEILDETEFVQILMEYIGESTYTLNGTRTLSRCKSLLQKACVREAILAILRRRRHPVMIIRTLYGLGLLEDDEFREVAEGKIPAIARRFKRPQRIRDLSYIITCVCRVPMLYNSAEIQGALTTTIVKTKKPQDVFRAIENRDEVFRADAIRAAFAKKLRLTRDPLGLLKKVIHTPHMMQCQNFQEAVALALRRFWKSRQKCLMAYKIDYDSWRYVFRDLLPPLTDYPELGRIEDFQQAVASLLVQAELPGAVLREADKFDELLHTEVMTNAIEQLIEQQTDTYTIKRFSRDLPPMYQAKAKMKLEELEDEERRRQYSYDYLNPEDARPGPSDGYDDWYNF